MVSSGATSKVIAIAAIGTSFPPMRGRSARAGAGAISPRVRIVDVTRGVPRFRSGRGSCAALALTFGYPFSVIACTRARLSRVEQRRDQDQHRERQHDRRDRPLDQDRDVALRHHERLAQRPLHASPSTRPRISGAVGIFELAHQRSRAGRSRPAGRGRTAARTRCRRRRSRCRG